MRSTQQIVKHAIFVKQSRSGACLQNLEFHDRINPNTYFIFKER